MLKGTRINFSFVGIISVFLSFSLAAAETTPLSSSKSPGLSKKELIHNLVEERNPQVEKLMHSSAVFLKQGRILDAIEYLQAAKDIAPYDSRVYLLLTEVFFQAYQDDQALKTLGEAMTQNTEIDFIFKQLAVWHNNFKINEAPQELPLISVASFKDDRRAAMTFNFDDGCARVYTLAVPMFENFGYRATIFLNPGITTEGTVPGSWDSWRDAHKRGFEVGNHTMHHYNLTEVPQQVLEDEIEQGYNIIKEKIGEAPLTFAFPFDKDDAASLLEVKKRHLVVRDFDTLYSLYPHIMISVYGGRYFKTETAQRIIDLALQKRLWLIAEFHDVTEDDNFPGFKAIKKDLLQSHLTYIKEREDKIWVDTYINVFRYLTEKKRSRLKIIEQGENKMTFDITSPLDTKFYSMPLTVIINTEPLQPQSTEAEGLSTQEKLPARIGDKRIYINVPPNQGKVSVEWK